MFEGSDMALDLVSEWKIKNEAFKKLLIFNGFSQHLVSDHKTITSVDAALVTSFMQFYLQDRWDDYVGMEKLCEGMWEKEIGGNSEDRELKEFFLCCASFIKIHQTKIKSLGADFHAPFWLGLLEITHQRYEQNLKS